MNKEQEVLKPCPFCGGKAVLSSDHVSTVGTFYAGLCTGCGVRGAQWSAEATATSAWNRRSSDEQADVAGWQWRYVGGSAPYVHLFGTEWRTPLENADRADLDGSAEFETRNLYASPPAVAAGGVTDQAVEAACKAFYGEAAWQFPRGIISKPSSIIAMRRALSAVLAVGDEGIREGERFPVTLGKVHQAIDAYVQALVDRQHGGVAQDRAFNAICEALGRSPTAEMDARRLPPPPSRGEGE